MPDAPNPADAIRERIRKAYEDSQAKPPKAKPDYAALWRRRRLGKRKLIVKSPPGG